jgi:Fe-S-cluster-containing hydrogenase component 2
MIFKQGVIPMDSYEQLAKVLDTIPNGFPATKGGEHLAVLRWIFTPEEAEIAAQLKLRGETCDEISGRLGRNPDQTCGLLERMVKKGQISGWNSRSGDRKYALMPFAVGIYEEQLERMDEEFARLFEEYFIAGFKDVLNVTEPVGFKVIPVNRSLNPELQVFPYEVAEELVKNAKSIGVRDCICKKQQELLGNSCEYPMTVCISLNPRREHAFDEESLSTPISTEDALKLLREAEEAGLVHCTMNVGNETSIRYICNCCSCCCGVLRGVKMSKEPRMLVRTDYVAKVDSDLCVGCEACIDRCQMDAIVMDDSVAHVNTERCIGCGVCALACPEGALAVVRKPSTLPDSPESLMDWMVQRATSRGVDPSDLL